MTNIKAPITVEAEKIAMLAQELAKMCAKQTTPTAIEVTQQRAWLAHENASRAIESNVGDRKIRIKNDLTGMVFGGLTVLHPTTPYVRPNGKHRTMYMCQCDCGNIRSIQAERLTNGRATSCGCRITKKLNLVDQQYGDLTVVAEAETLVNEKGVKVRQWLCKCNCGEYLVAKQDELRQNTMTSCKKCEDAKLPNLTDMVFGKWKVLCKAEPMVVNDSRGYKTNVRAWMCQCECGTVRSVKEGNLLSGMSTSCGCKRNRTKPQKSWKGVDLTGMTFGKWTVIEAAKPITYTPNIVQYNAYQVPRWTCKCECGTVREVLQCNLTSGSSNSCGCSRVATRKSKRNNQIIVPRDAFTFKESADSLPEQ